MLGLDEFKTTTGMVLSGNKLGKRTPQAISVLVHAVYGVYYGLKETPMKFSNARNDTVYIVCSYYVR